MVSDCLHYMIFCSNLPFLTTLHRLQPWTWMLLSNLCTFDCSLDVSHTAKQLFDYWFFDVNTYFLLLHQY